MPKLLSVSFVSLLVVAGCSQLIGLGDYEIDPSLDGAAGDAGAQGGDGSGGKSPGGAGSDQGGEPGAGAQGGDPGVAGQGGEPGSHGGEPPITQAGAGGQGGEPAVIIDCDSADCCDEAGGEIVETELVLNGDFEAGRAAWSQGYITNTEYSVLVKETASSIDANSGSWYAWLGGVESDSCYLDSPSFVIPKRTGWITATGYRYFAFDSLEGTGDLACLVMYVAGTSDVAEAFDCWDNYEFDTEDWVDFSYSVPAADYIDGEYTFSTVADTDDMFDGDPEDEESQKASNFFFDDLSLKAATCVKR